MNDKTSTFEHLLQENNEMKKKTEKFAGVNDRSI